MKFVNNDGIHFKSIPYYWYVERSGEKSNTIRDVTVDEWGEMQSDEVKEIYIENSQTGEVFVRTISHKMVWTLHDYMVGILISWRHPTENNVCTL